MKRILVIAIAALSLIGVSVAQGNGGKPSHKVYVCHKGHTLSVDNHALKAHMKHGDKAGKCNSGSGGNPPVGNPGDPPVTSQTFSQVNRILACADRPVLRVADNTMGIAVDLTVEVFNSGIYRGANFTVARWYPPIAGVHPGGATCEKLGGTFTGKTLDGYPVWTR